MICIYCGKEIEDDIRYCPFCGAVYNNLEYIEPEKDDTLPDEAETVIENNETAEVIEEVSDNNDCLQNDEELSPEESDKELKKETNRDIVSALAIALGGILLIRRLFKKK